MITGASRGLGRALAAGLAREGFDLIIDARDAAALDAAAGALRAAAARRAAAGRYCHRAFAGDITDPAHRAALLAAARAAGRLDLLVNNAGTLGASPLPALADYPPDELRAAFEVNVIAPIALTQLALPLLRASGGAVLNITSDAAVEAYAGWGGYGAAKAALEQASNVLAAEEPTLRVWWADPGDLRTDMHQLAFPGEDISDRPEPSSVVPAFLRLVTRAAAERPVPRGAPHAGDAHEPGRTLRPGRTSPCPPELEAHDPPEARGLARDGVRMLVSRRSSGEISHHGFRRAARPAAPRRPAGGQHHGDAARPGPGLGRAGGALLRPAPGRIVAGRTPAGHGQDLGAERRGYPGQLLTLPGGAVLTLEGRATARLWRARLSVAVVPYLLRHGVPIRYSYVPRDWPLSYYQTVFAREPGSAEMPSASRPFTPSVVTQLVARGVLIAPLTLHCGVSSLEGDEDPYPEPYDVPPATADLVNHVRARGGRVIAGRHHGGPRAGDGRAACRRRLTGGRVAASAGWTSHVVTPETGVRAVDGLLTGLHEPRSSHLRMLAAFAGPGAARPVLPGRDRSPGTCGTSSVTFTCCCRNVRAVG